MLRASQREMKRAYRAHVDAATKLGASRTAALLVTYGVECGLKAAIMMREKALDTERLLNFPAHDLRVMLKRLAVPATLTISDTRTAQPDLQNVTPSQLHEAFRYGIDIKRTSEICGELSNVLTWLQRELA